MKKPFVLLLHIFLMFAFVFSFDASVAFPYSVTLSWNAPTKNANGTPLTDLSGYNVYYGKQHRNYDSKIRVGNVKEYAISNLLMDVNYYCAVTAYDTSGNESSYSDEVIITGYSLTVNKSGTGSGTVTSSPAGITCGTACTKGYDAGSIVTLTTTPDGNSTFTGWSGGGCSGKSQCVLVMSAPVTVTANFSTKTTSTQIIIDNRDPETSKSGTWQVSAGAMPYGADSFGAFDGAIFKWNFTPYESGLYEVSLWWTVYPNRSTNIPVDIGYSGGKARVYVNQKENGGQWNNLGRFYFNKGTSYAITIIAQPYPASTCADAVKFQLVQ